MNPAIVDLQEWLNAHGYADPPLAVDGIDGPAMQPAIDALACDLLSHGGPPLAALAEGMKLLARARKHAV